MAGILIKRTKPKPSGTRHLRKNRFLGVRDKRRLARRLCSGVKVAWRARLLRCHRFLNGLHEPFVEPTRPTVPRQRIIFGKKEPRMSFHTEGWNSYSGELSPLERAQMFREHWNDERVGDWEDDDRVDYYVVE